MEKLNKFERDYVASGGDIPLWRNPNTKVWENYPLTSERRDFLDGLLVEETDHLLYMDSHGVCIKICVYKETADGPLLGFIYGQNSEESFFDYWEDDSIAGPFEISKRKITTYEYRRTDGSGWEK